MHKDELKAIRYLMKEMDPSEELEFEQLMREDENLLIEVESLRATNRRLSELSPKNPPQTLTQQIVDDAKQLQKQRVNSSRKSYIIFRKAVAAALVLFVLSGGYYYYTGSTKAVQSAEPQVNSEEVKPWVDRNEILRYSTDQYQLTNQTAGSQKDFNNSFNKLELVNDPTVNPTSPGDILLTGSPN